MAELNVQITASIKELERALSKAKNELKKFDKNVPKPKVIPDPFSKVKAGAVNATPAVQEFSRVIQDAPFGIQGVANNIQQLTANFGNLSKSAGGTVPALRAMFGALAGPAGILLAVSAVTSLLTVYADKLKFATSLTKEIAKATGEFVTSAQSEILVLKNLIGIANDENVAKFARERAITQINEKYGKYLGNLDLEIIKTQEVKNKVDALTKSLLDQAKVRGIQAAIEKRIGESGEDFTELLLKQRLSANAVANEVNRLIDNVAAFNKVSKDLPLTEQIKELQNIVNKAGGSGKGLLFNLAGLIGQFNAASRKTKEFSKEFEKDIKPLEGLLKGLTLEKLISDLDEINEVIVTAGKAGPGGKKGSLLSSFIPPKAELDQIFAVTKGIGPALVEPITLAARQAKPQLDLISQALSEFNAEANAIIQGSIGNTFSFLGEAIGAGLASGESIFTAFGKSLLGAMGNFLSSMGDLLIKYGTLAIAKGKIDAAIAAGGPIAIGAGLAAIAVGVAVKAAGAAISRTATRGFGSGFGTGAVAGQGGFSSVGGGNFGASGSGTQTVVFEIAGTKLLGVLKNTQERNLRLGGSQLAL